MKHSLGLAMIMKDEVKDLDRIVKNYGRFFDTIYLTVTDKPTYLTLLNRQSNTKNTGKIELSYFKWCDHFGKARRFNQKQIKTDYWMWIDLDDEIDRVENIPKAIELMEMNEIDAVLFKYDYLQNEHGFSEFTSWRERIIRSGSGLRWENVACHETLNTSKKVKVEPLGDIVIKHRKTVGQMQETITRDKTLLEKDWIKQKSPRTAYYLGSCNMVEKNLNSALKLFQFAAKHSSTNELKLKSWVAVSDCYYLMKKYNLALRASNRAIHIDSGYSKPWYQKTLIYMAMNDFDKAIRCVEEAMRKKSSDYLAYSQDPTLDSYKGLFLAAKAYLYKGDAKRAYELFSRVKEIAPFFTEQQKNDSIDWSQLFEEAYSNYNMIS